VLVVGSRIGELDTWGKAPSWGEPGKQKVIHMDIDPLSIGLNRPVDVAINGDAAAVMPALLAAVRARADSTLPPCTPSSGSASSSASGSSSSTPPLPAISSIQAACRPRRARLLPPRRHHRARRRQHHYLGRQLQPHLPAAQLPLHRPFRPPGHRPALRPRRQDGVAPDRPVYLLSGDGAIGFNIQELETARRYNLPVTVVVIADRGWGMERSSQMFARIGGMVETELYPGARYDQVAEAFGCYGTLVTSLDELKPALQAAADSGLPALVQV
jgi:acetolactate synthase I/II/III large subunit